MVSLLGKFLFRNNMYAIYFIFFLKKFCSKNMLKIVREKNK